MSSNYRGIIPWDNVIRIGQDDDGICKGYGCGYGASASGKIYCHYPGRHTAPQFRWWDTDEQFGGISYDEMDSWAGGSIGSTGDGNRFSVNADQWLCTLPGTEGSSRASDGSNCILVNIDKSKKTAINVTGNNPGQFAYVGSFWASSLADVNDDLKTFVENRNARKAHWDKLFAQTIKLDDAVSAGRTHHYPHKRMKTGAMTAHKLLQNENIELYSLMGKRVLSSRGSNARTIPNTPYMWRDKVSGGRGKVLYNK